MADPIFKKDKVYQRFNLKEMFGVDFGQVPELKDAIAQAIIDKIITRTKEGKAIGGKRELRAYSKEYINSLQFKAHGKSPGEVNMTLSGDMLGTMDKIEDTRNTVSIGWDDPLQAAKAYNHNTGDTVKKRRFFGLTKGEIDEIRRQFKTEVKEAVRVLKTEGRDEYTKKATAILKTLTEGGGDGED